MFVDKKLDVASGFRYLEYSSYETVSAGSLIFLHGSGEWGNSLDRINRYGLPRLLADRAIELNCKVVCPQQDDDGEWCSKRLQTLSDSINAESCVLAVVGFSRGGKALCNWISEYGVVAPLAVVVAGRGDESVSGSLSGLTLVSIHGYQDPYPNMEGFLLRCKEIGADVDEIILKERDHFISEEIFANSKLTSIFAAAGVQIRSFRSHESAQ